MSNVIIIILVGFFGFLCYTTVYKNKGGIKMDTISTENLSKIIADGKSYAIITHRRPDGDAISSSMAMFWYLIDIGKSSKDIDVIIPEFLNDFSFIPGIEHLIKEPTKEEYDVLIVVDCANMHLLKGINLLKSAKQIICFDHHEETSINANYCIIERSAPSCTCILYDTFHCKEKNFLDCIATGLISDTANLSLNVTDFAKATLKSLENLGVDTNYILSKLNSQSIRTLELVRIAKNRGWFKTSSGNVIFCTYLLQSDLLDSEKNLNTVNHKAIIAELQKSVKYTSLILLIENEKGEFKGSLRTFDSNLDLNKICSKLVSEEKFLKGGGHSYSAGCTAIGSYFDIIELIASEILNY